MLAVPSHSHATYARLADPGDEEPLMAMLRTLHGENALRSGTGEPLKICEDKVRATLQNAITPGGAVSTAEPSWIVVIDNIDQPGHLEGSVCLSIMEPWYSRETFLAETWNFVLPQFRKSNNAKVLIGFSKALANALKLDLVMGVMSTNREPAKMRLYEKSLGCKPYGGYFLFNYNQDETDSRAGA